MLEGYRHLWWRARVEMVTSEGMKKLFVILLFGIGFGSAEVRSQTAFAEGSWQMLPAEDRIDLMHNGQLVTSYHVSKNVPRPYFYPIIGPGGMGVTRGYPMEDSETREEHDHVQHRSLWFGHRRVNGIDFWSENAGDGRQLHTGITSVQIESKSITLKVNNDWVTAGGRKVLQDAREFRLARTQNGSTVIDFQITLQATEGPVIFGDTEEAALGLRMAHWMRLVKKDRKTPQKSAAVINSEDVRGRAVWGKRAKWIDYFATDPNGLMVGIALMDHPSNLRHPTWWHARDYGLVAANAFGQSQFENGATPGAGDFSLPENGELTMRWRVMVHPGSPSDADVDGAYRDYIAE